ncbi:MAG TPA: response regulator, partial [Promineifilum sp.]|nr:response regulator [Promineifilum sp.]
MPSLLVIDDDRAVVHFIKAAFKNADLEVLAAATADEGLKLLRSGKPDVVLLDILLPQTTGLKLFETIREIDDSVPVVFITASGESDTAIEAMKLGAFDFLLKPLDVTKVKHLVDQALEIRRLTAIPVEVPEMSTASKGDQALIGRSPQMLEVYKAIGRVAPQTVTVLIRGESGTGKELIAR